MLNPIARVVRIPLQIHKTMRSAPLTQPSHELRYPIVKLLHPLIKRLALPALSQFLHSRPVAIVRVEYGTQPSFLPGVVDYFESKRPGQMAFGVVNASEPTFSLFFKDMANRVNPGALLPVGYYLFRDAEPIGFHNGLVNHKVASLTDAVLVTLAALNERISTEAVVTAFEEKLNTPPMPSVSDNTSSKNDPLPALLAILGLPANCPREKDRVKAERDKLVLGYHTDRNNKNGGLTDMARALLDAKVTEINNAYAEICRLMGW